MPPFRMPTQPMRVLVQFSMIFGELLNESRASVINAAVFHGLEFKDQTGALGALGVPIEVYEGAPTPPPLPDAPHHFRADAPVPPLHFVEEGHSAHLVHKKKHTHSSKRAHASAHVGVEAEKEARPQPPGKKNGVHDEELKDAQLFSTVEGELKMKHGATLDNEILSIILQKVKKGDHNVPTLVDFYETKMRLKNLQILEHSELDQDEEPARIEETEEDEEPVVNDESTAAKGGHKGKKKKKAHKSEEGSDESAKAIVDTEQEDGKAHEGKAKGSHKGKKKKKAHKSEEESDEGTGEGVAVQEEDGDQVQQDEKPAAVEEEEEEGGNGDPAAITATDVFDENDNVADPAAAKETPTPHKKHKHKKHKHTKKSVEEPAAIMEDEYEEPAQVEDGEEDEDEEPAQVEDVEEEEEE